mmetsp:Transcript_24931/g.40419  ORF Transcript_24931/g.40419 Transcript_24931/m.40419 type:complete len:265 (+) Transcript_24931:1411-2205(+)
MLSHDEIEQFIHQGYVVLRGAFSRDAGDTARDDILWPILEQHHGLDKQDKGTWPQRVGIKEVFGNDKAPWDRIVTDKLCAAIDQLLGGREKWNKDDLGLGWWIVSFPGSGTGKWHVDGAHFTHHAHSKEQGLLPIFLLSDIEQGGGGTAVAAGSHKHVARILLEHPEGISGGDLSWYARKTRGILENVVELTGSVGDVALLHPFLLHARSANNGSVRFICNPCVALNDDMDLESGTSPVELPIMESKVRQQLPLSFGRKKARYF